MTLWSDLIKYMRKKVLYHQCLDFTFLKIKSKFLSKNKIKIGSVASEVYFQLKMFFFLTKVKNML
jgi:hypothetical protein